MTLQTLRTFNRLQLRHPHHKEQGQEGKKCSQLRERGRRKELRTVIVLFAARALCGHTMSFFSPWCFYWLKNATCESILDSQQQASRRNL